MIFHLMGEQKDEDEHKLWCDMETEKSTESKDDKAIKLLVKQITEQQEKVAEITSNKETETKLREENHAEIVATIKDAADAQAAITEAIAVLKDFYKESGILTILDETMQKFSKMEADAKVADETDQKDYEA